MLHNKFQVLHYIYFFKTYWINENDLLYSRFRRTTRLVFTSVNLNGHG